MENREISIVLVNSIGPMGSMLVAALVEKMGFLNLPIRQMGTTEILLGEAELNGNWVKQRYREQLLALANPIKTGGMSIPTRDQGNLAPRVKFDKVIERLTQLEKRQFLELKDWYNESRCLVASGLTYKQAYWKAGNHVELIIDSTRFSDQDFVIRYKEEFDNVYFIHLTRNLEEWLEASISQYLYRQDRTRYGFRLHAKIRNYRTYLNQIEKMEGLVLDLEELTFPNTKYAIRKIEGHLRMQSQAESMGGKYDLWGSLFEFDAAFRKADYPGRYLTKLTRWVIRRITKNEKVTRIHSVIFHPLFLFELFRHVVIQTITRNRRFC
jgi:hypothetical protein